MAYTINPITYQYNPDAYYTGYGRAGANFRAPSPFFNPVAGNPITLYPGSNFSGGQYGRGPTQFPTPEQPSVMASLLPLGFDAAAGTLGSYAGDAAAASRVDSVPFRSAADEAVYYHPLTKPMGGGGIYSTQPGGTPVRYYPRAGTLIGHSTTVPRIDGATAQFTNVGDPLGRSLTGDNVAPDDFGTFSVLGDAGSQMYDDIIVSPGKYLKKSYQAITGTGPKTAAVGPTAGGSGSSAVAVGPTAGGSQGGVKYETPTVAGLTQEAPMWDPAKGFSASQQLAHNLYPAAYQGAISGLGAFGGSVLTDLIRGEDIDFKRAGTKFADVGLGASLGRAVTGSGFYGGIAGGIAGLFRVICTELNSQGLLTDNELRAEQWYTLKKIHPLVIRGYHVWAVPYVRLMQKSSRFSAFTNWWAGARAKEILYKCGKRDKPHYGGKLARLVVEPFCFVIGCVAWAFDIPELEWRNGFT